MTTNQPARHRDDSQLSPLLERFLTDPKYMLGAVAATGILAVGIWVLLPNSGTGDGAREQGGGALFASRSQAASSSAAAGGAKRERRKRLRRGSMTPAEAVFADEDGSPIADTAPPTASAATRANSTGLESQGPLSETTGETMAGETQAQGATEDNRFQAEGQLGKRDFGGGGRPGSAGGGGGGGALMAAAGPAAKAAAPVGSARAAAPELAASPAAKSVAALRAAAGIGGGSRATRALAASGTRPGSGAASSPGASGATGLDTSVFNQNGTGGNGGGSQTAPPVAPVAPVAAADPVGSSSRGGGGAGGGAAKGAGESTDGGTRGARAKGSELSTVAADLKKAAEQLEARAAKPAMTEVARLAQAMAQASGGAAADMASFKARVASDQNYFRTTYNAPSIAGNLDGVEDALHDSTDGIVERLNVNSNRLNNAQACLRRYAGDGTAAAADLAAAAHCARAAESGLDQRESDLRKLASLKLAADGWARSAIGEVSPDCPKPARQPATAKEIGACNALDYIGGAASAHAAKLGGAQAKLGGVSADGATASAVAGAIAENRELVGASRGLINERALPPGLAAGELRRNLNQSVVSLDFAAGSWTKSGTLPPGPGAAEAARGTSKLLEGMSEAREAGRIAGMIAEYEAKAKK